MIAFSKLSTEDLNNPNFEIPLLDTISAPKAVDFKSQTGSRKISVSSGSNSKKNTLSNKGSIRDPSFTDLNQTYATVEKGMRRKKSPE